MKQMKQNKTKNDKPKTKTKIGKQLKDTIEDNTEKANLV